MKSKKNSLDQDKMNQIIADARHHRRQQEDGYRERALKLFPWVCAKCSREFEGKRLRELTVHHRDHNHDNNPPDGSNWELLCIYCHDNEHSRHIDQELYGTTAPEGTEQPTALDSPFANLKDLLNNKK